LEITIDLPIGFPINNSISLSVICCDMLYTLVSCDVQKDCIYCVRCLKNCSTNSISRAVYSSVCRALHPAWAVVADNMATQQHNNARNKIPYENEGESCPQPRPAVKTKAVCAGPALRSVFVTMAAPGCVWRAHMGGVCHLALV